MKRWTTTLVGALILQQSVVAFAAPFAAVLPTSRSVVIGNTATAFATVINADATTANGCRVELNSSIDADFFFQTTDPLTNQVTGTINMPVDIPASGSQSFVFGVTPNTALPATVLALAFICDNVGTAASIEGLNTLSLSASNTATADMIVLAQTASMDGIMAVEPGGVPSAFAAATVNVGAASDIQARARAGFVFDGSMTICQTDSTTGACLANPTTVVDTTIQQDETSTFSVFVSANSSIVADFANSRVFLEFFDNSGEMRGSTSIAIEEGEPNVINATLGLISGGVGLADPNTFKTIEGLPVELQVYVGGSGFRRLGIGDDSSLLALSGSGVALGAIDAFGSIIINGRAIDTSSAEFSIDGVAGTQSGLRIGQDALVILGSTPDTAKAVIYRSKTKGPITEIIAANPLNGTAELLVLGQRVLLNAVTFLDGVSIGTLTAGQLLEVSGIPDATGATVASNIELKASLETYKVTGVIESLGANTFAIGGLTINFETAQIDDFVNDQLFDGAIVEVKGLPADFIAPAGLTAAKVELLPRLRIDQSASLQLGGFIDSFDSSSEFTVQRQQIRTTAATQIIDGTLASLALGVKVEIKGSADSEGVLVAESVRIEPTESIRAEAVLTDLDVTAGTLSLLGVTFKVTAQTQFEDETDAEVYPLMLTQLATGDYVEIRGYLDGESLIAVEIEREDFDERARLGGPVSSFDASTASAVVLGVTLRGEEGITQYEDLDDQPLTQTEFFQQMQVGEFIKGTWDVFSSTSEVVDELSFED